ncbi:MAG: helix-turn-helix transcriptional regulator [Fimbriimonadaceae bacterium]
MTPQDVSNSTCKTEKKRLLCLKGEYDFVKESGKAQDFKKGSHHTPFASFCDPQKGAIKMNEATLNKIVKPTTDRRIRCERTNTLKEPGSYDLSNFAENFLKIETEAKPTKSPRFVRRICTIPEPVYHPFTRDIELNRVLYCIEGQALLISPDGETQFITTGSGLIIPAGIEYDLLLGRGTQNWLSSIWESDSPAVSLPENFGTQVFTIVEVSHIFKELTQAVIELPIEEVPSQNLLLAWLNMLIFESKPGGCSFALLPKIQEEAQNVKELLQAIKNNPAADWNLNSASAVAGYSPFHLSRVFRSTIHMGMPKFVETCRTEQAIKELLTGNIPLNLISEKCGFGTPQAMRTAIREITGFLPSEIRPRQGE